MSPRPRETPDAARWAREQALFHQAAALPRDEQRPFLERSCADDAAMLDSVLSLLDADAAAGDSILERGVAHAADGVLSHADTRSIPAFGPYRITGVLGEGGMGVVHLAERTDLGSLVAIKLLRDAWLSPARRERFAAEQRTLAQLNHPAIARLFDAGTLPDGTPWFVMEYVRGMPITEYCRARGSNIVERLTLFRAVCEAVQHAHRHAVIHRDLKPSNILVTEDGAVKLLDFGIAKQIASLEMSADDTVTGLRLMTPAYAAPEQLRGDRVGIHSDVYSLGVVLYELLTDRLPHDLSKRTPAEAELIVFEQTPVKPSLVAKAVTARAVGTGLSRSVGRASWDDLDVLCLTAMHKDASRRYRAVDALIRDVDHFLRGQPLEARPDSATYKAAKFVRRNWRAVAAAVVVLAVVVAQIIVYTMRVTAARNAAVAEAARTQRIQRFMTSLFAGGDQAAGPADSLRVVTLLDRGVQEAGALEGEPEVQAELLETLGALYQKLGNHVRADSLMQASLARREAIFGPTHARTAASLTGLSLLRVDQAAFDEAERYARRALDVTRATLPADHPQHATTLAALGRVLQERGAYDEAIRIQEEAVRLRARDPGARADLAMTLNELASTAFYAGHLDRSDSLNRVVLEMHRDMYGERHPLIADDLINLGAIEQQRGRYPEAERFYRAALDINREWFGENDHRTASTLTMVGRSLILQNRLDEATRPLAQALEIRERAYGAVHPRVASTLNEIGTLALRRKDLDEAEVAFVRMGRIYEQVYGGKHWLVALALSNRASVEMERARFGHAERLYRDAVGGFTAALAPDHLNTGIARVKLGRALLRQRRYAEAERECIAGYEILLAQTSPTVSWVKNALEDLIEINEALGRSTDAERYRTALADTTRR